MKQETETVLAVCRNARYEITHYDTHAKAMDAMKELLAAVPEDCIIKKFIPNNWWWGSIYAKGGETLSAAVLDIVPNQTILSCVSNAFMCSVTGINYFTYDSVEERDKKFEQRKLGTDNFEYLKDDDSDYYVAIRRNDFFATIRI